MTPAASQSKLLEFLTLIDLEDERAGLDKVVASICAHPNDTLGPLYTSYTALALSGDLSQARERARLPLPNRRQCGGDHPHYGRLVRHLAGELSDEALLAVSRGSRAALCEAHYFVGLNYLARGDRLNAAEHFAASIETGAIFHLTRMVSIGFLHRLRQDPDWPSTIPPESNTGSINSYE